MDDVLKRINKLNLEVEKDLSGGISMDILLNPEFMEKYTKFASFDDMLDKSGFVIKTQEDFQKIPDYIWDDYIKGNTDFQTWDELQRQAAEEYTVMKFKEAGFDRL